MPINTAAVGTSTEPFTATIDRRWTMAYAAALGDHLACYMDSTRPDEQVAHPLFPVCFEWPVVQAPFPVENTLTREETGASVHASHDLQIHRLVRPGDEVTTRGTCVGVEARRPGAYTTTRYDTIDANGEAVCTTYQGGLSLGTGTTGDDRQDGEIPELLPPPAVEKPEAEIPIHVPAGMAHVYTECARIWNPIHTDPAVAHAGGLPEIILHGTATLALAVSKIVVRSTGGHPERVSRIAGRFSGMVLMPSDLTLAILHTEAMADRQRVFFEVLNPAAGRAAITGGLVEIL